MKGLGPRPHSANRLIVARSGRGLAEYDRETDSE